MRRLPLIWRVFLSTSLFTTLVFALIGWVVQNHSAATTSLILEDELQSSFRAYESLWKARADMLASVSRVVGGMPEVRSAFGTGDRATIRDVAGELWVRIAQGDAVFLVTDPEGKVIASLSSSVPASLTRIDAVEAATPKFPEQGTGFTFLGDQLHRVVITPVYVDTARGPGLINVLVTGFPVDNKLARTMRDTTGGGEALIVASARVVASTLDESTTARLASLPVRTEEFQKLETGSETWSVLATVLRDVAGNPIGELRILRPFTSVTRRITDLRVEIGLVWAAAILFGLLVTFVAANRLLAPLKLLDAAAREVGRGNYDYRVPLDGDDEIGRLGRTFNAMSASIRESREELIRQERINTLGRIASSVVHDLRNPLAAIYSGAELLVDSDGMPQAHIHRLAVNIYRSSRQVLLQLDDLLALSRGNKIPAEVCRLQELVEDAWSTLATQADAARIRFRVEGDTTVEAAVARSRMERVFTNLFANAIEAMGSGGTVTVDIGRENGSAVVRVCDTGPGVPPQIRERLFQPFTTAGKSNGLGLGLALSRQTVIEHGGDLALVSGAGGESASGACFVLRLPGITEPGKN